MDYTAHEAIQFGDDMISAGRIAIERNKRKGEQWIVNADISSMRVTLQGIIEEEVDIFTRVAKTW